jgi:hypothetical protein
MLSVEEIRHLLGLLGQETVVEPSKTFPFRVTRAQPGYSDDPLVGPLQAKLSIMLEAAQRGAAKKR